MGVGWGWGGGGVGGGAGVMDPEFPVQIKCLDFIITYS